MRLMQIFEQSLQDNTKYVISIDRLDNMPDFVLNFIKHKVHISFPDKKDRIQILGKHHAAEKYLQGKTYKEI